MSEVQVLATAEELLQLAKDLAPSDNCEEVADALGSPSSDAVRSKTKRAKAKLADAFGVEGIDNVVHDFLLSSENCARCLPDAHKADFRQEGGDAVVKALAEYYDDARCSYIKTKLRLSQPQYTLLRDLLTKRYDPATASHVPLVIEGSMLEALPSLYHVNKFETDLIQHLGLQEGKRGKCASANVQTKFISDIEQHLKDGHLLLVDGKLVGEGGKPVVVAWSFDACRVFRGMKTTAFGYRFVNLINAPANSPVYFHEFALMEAGDDHESILENCGELVKEVNALHATNAVKVTARRTGQDPVGPVTITDLTHLVVLDLAAYMSSLGLGGNNMEHPCPKCKAAKGDLSNAEGRVWKGCAGQCAHCAGCDGTSANGCGGCDKCDGCQGPPAGFFCLRTFDEMCVLSHTVAGKQCPGCAMQIVDEVTDARTQRPVFKAGGKTPKVPAFFVSSGHTHCMLHFNQLPGQVPLFNLPLNCYCICTLHLHLRFISMMWAYSVLSDPDLSKKVKGRKGKGADDGTLAAWIWVVLHKIGVHVKLPSSPAKDVNKYYHSISKHSFHGRDASQLLTVWGRILRMVYSEDQLPTNRKKKKAKA